jgi:hypothetical protein
MRTVEWEIIQGRERIWTITRDAWDIGIKHGRQYKPTLPTLRRIAKVIHNHCTIQLIPDGYSLIIRANRKERVTP